MKRNIRIIDDYAYFSIQNYINSAESPSTTYSSPTQREFLTDYESFSPIIPSILASTKVALEDGQHTLITHQFSSMLNLSETLLPKFAIAYDSLPLLVQRRMLPSYSPGLLDY